MLKLMNGEFVVYLQYGIILSHIKNAILSYVVIYMHLEAIMLSEIG